MAIKIWLHGLNGRMGQEIEKHMASSEDLKIIGGSGYGNEITAPYTSLGKGLAAADVIIDFTNQEGNEVLLAEASSHKGKKYLIGSTGLTKAQRDKWKALCENDNAVLFAPNTSLGILLTMKLCQEAAKLLSPQGFDIEILESHHRHKVDAPSGTAKFLADKICEVTPLKPKYEGRTGVRKQDELGVTALRGGSVFGEHEVRFMGESEEIMISHRALNRALFAKGAIVLARWLSKEASLGTYQGLEAISLKDISS